MSGKPRPRRPAAADDREGSRAAWRRLAGPPTLDARRLACNERADLAAFLATLSAQQWQAPTLCEQWRVRDVVAHVLSYDDMGPRGLLALAARGRFRLGRINAAALARYAASSPRQLLVRLVATDLPFAAAVGPEVRGPAEALLMAIAGRRGIASELTGPGQAKLARRLRR